MAPLVHWETLRCTLKEKLDFREEWLREALSKPLFPAEGSCGECLGETGLECCSGPSLGVSGEEAGVPEGDPGSDAARRPGSALLFCGYGGWPPVTSGAHVSPDPLVRLLLLLREESGLPT